MFELRGGDGGWVGGLGGGGEKNCLFLLLRVKEINGAESLVLLYPPRAGGADWALTPSRVPAACGGRAQGRP